MSWIEDTVVPPGHNMTCRDALHTVSVGGHLRVAIPEVIMNMFSPLRKINLAIDELHVSVIVPIAGI
jgi:hypothetical protein